MNACQMHFLGLMLLFALYAPLSWAQGPCEKHLQQFENRLRQDPNLSQMKEARMNRSGRLQRPVRRYQALRKDPSGTTYSTRLTIYGQPYRLGSHWVVDYTTSETDKVLRRVSLEKFTQKALPHFVRTQLTYGNWLLLPSLRKGERRSSVFEFYQVEKALGDHVLMRSLSGEKRYVLLRDLFLANAFVTETEADLFLIFLSLGGTGEAIRLKTPNGSQTDGYYLHVEKLPDAHEKLGKRFPLFKAEVLGRVQELLQQGIPILLCPAVDHGLAGGMLRRNTRSNRFFSNRIAHPRGGSPAKAKILITSATDVEILEHEYQHWLDDGEFDDLLWKNLVYATFEIDHELEDKQIGSIFTFLNEQRANARELEVAAQRGSPGFKERRSEILKTFIQTIIPETNNSLNRIQKHSPKAYRKVIQVLKAAQLPSEYLTLETLIPEHFADP